MPTKSTRSKLPIFRQLCEYIPRYVVGKFATECGVASRTITPTSHVICLLYAQFTHAIGLNDVCDSLKANTSALSLIRGAKAPSKNGLSNANRKRNPEMAAKLFWFMLGHLQSMVDFIGSGISKMPRRFKRSIHVIDSTTIQLVAQCMDWAKHRRRKAAAKLHLRLDLQTFLPSVAVVDSAKGHDNTKAHELCAGLQPGEIVVFDMAYLEYAHLRRLDERGVTWVSRVKDNMKLRCVKCLQKGKQGRILRDDLVVIQSKTTRKDYPKRMRRVTAMVEIDGQDREMVFFTNNLDWAAQSICDLYQARWNIEVFFKHIKQNLLIGDFLGHNRNAIEWQLWTALLAYLLMRYCHVLSQWTHTFTRLFTALRAVLWQHRDLLTYLKSYGTAADPVPIHWAPKQAYLPGINWEAQNYRG